MHKNIPVVSLSINDNYYIEKMGRVLSKERMPVGLNMKNLALADFSEWFFSRAIPQKREGIDLILKATRTSSNRELLVKNFGLGITDCYWIKPETSDLRWENINFFENKFSSEVDGVYLNKTDKEGNVNEINSINPNNVSSGNLPKGWICENDKRYMIKGSELLNYQEPYNEKIVSKWLDLLNVDHVRYDIRMIDKKPYSICESMLKNNEELISAYFVEKMYKKDNQKSYFEHYIDCCTMMGLNADLARKSLEEMILIDYMDANTDRHWNNFAVIRDADTLKAKCLAPLYDNGAALFANIATLDIKAENMKLKCQSFSLKQDENILHVKNYALLEKKEIFLLPELVDEILKSNKYLDEARRDEINARIKQRIITICKRFGISSGPQKPPKKT